MKRTRINWPLVHFKMAERKIGSLSALARMAGVHRNTLGRAGPFTSTTVDNLGDFFDCDPRELITVEEVPDTKPEPTQPNSTPAPARPRRATLDIDTSQIPPDKAAAEAERRAALLAQAAQRTAYQ